MSDIETSNWSETAASNNATPPNGFPEGMAASDVNNAAREMMAALKREWNRSHPTLTSGGSSNAYTLTPTTAIASYVAGQTFSFYANHTNTGAATLNVSALGTKDIVYSDGSTALAAGDVASGSLYQVSYDGTRFRLANKHTVASLTATGNISAAAFIPTGATVPTNGINLPSANTVGIAANSVQRMTINTRVVITGNSEKYALGISYNGVTAAVLIGSPSASALTFSDNGGAEHFRYDGATGLFGFGTTGISNTRLGVVGTGATSGSKAAEFQNSSGTVLLTIRNDGALLAVPTYNATTATAANMVIDSAGQMQRSTSSRRYKTNIRDYDKGLDALANLRPVYFNSKSDPDGKIHAGLIAEEVDEAGLTEYVTYNDAGQPDAVEYANIVALLICAVQESNEQVKVLSARVAALEANQ